MPYVVKVTAYLDQHGNPVSNIKDAKALKAIKFG